MIQKLKAKVLKFLTNVKRYQLEKAKLNKIVILRYDRIGDMVVSLPLCRSLKLGLPNSEIIMVASAVNAPIAVNCKFINRTLIKPQAFFSWIKCLLSLRLERADLAIDLNHAVTPHTIFAIRIIKPRHVASPFKDGRWGLKGSDLQLFDLMPKQHPKKYNRPIAETYLDIARHIGCSVDKCLPYPLPRYSSPPTLSKRYIVLNPAGSRRSMRIADSDLICILAHIQSQISDIRVVIPAMPQNYTHLKDLVAGVPNADVLPPNNSVEPILPLLQYATLVVTPDTALVHIACAYSTPLIAIYTSDQALFEQWRPLNHPNARVIRSPQPKSIEGYPRQILLSAISTALSDHPSLAFRK